MITTPKMEDDIGALAAKLLDCAKPTDGSTMNALLFALAAADVVASNFALLPPKIASQGFEWMSERMRASYAESRKIARPN